jgi:hypothetical protein
MTGDRALLRLEFLPGSSSGQPDAAADREEVRRARPEDRSEAENEIAQL